MASMRQFVCEYIPQVCYIPGKGWVGMVVTSEDEVNPVFTSQVIRHQPASHNGEHNKCYTCVMLANDQAEQWINARRY